MYKIYTVEFGLRKARIYATSKKDAVEYYRVNNQNMGTPTVVDIEKTATMQAGFEYSHGFCVKYNIF